MSSARPDRGPHHTHDVADKGLGGGVKPLRRDPRPSDVGGRGLRPPAPITLVNAVRSTPNRCLAASDLLPTTRGDAMETRRSLMCSTSHLALWVAGGPERPGPSAARAWSLWAARSAWLRWLLGHVCVSLVFTVPHR